MRALLILNDPPYGTERCYNALRLARSLLATGGAEAKLFLLGDAVACAAAGQKVPHGYYNLADMLGAVIRRGGAVGVCGSCMDARGIADERLVEGARRSSMDELASWTQWAEKCWCSEAWAAPGESAWRVDGSPRRHRLRPRSRRGPPSEMDNAAAERYDAWYRTRRGAWIGDIEFALLAHLLAARPGERLLDVGCGTGYFTRRCARELGVIATGLDPDPAALHAASRQAGPGERYVEGRAERLPFPDRCFERTICVTALAFIADQRQALREMVRVTRRRIVLGLLNRASLLYLHKGRGGGGGAYRGARWHTRREVLDLLADLPLSRLVIRSAVFLPGGGAIARAIEPLAPGGCTLGAFLTVAADVTA